jgi:hypothetical protein
MNLEKTFGEVVGANLFAHNLMLVRINSHLREQPNALKLFFPE